MTVQRGECEALKIVAQLAAVENAFESDKIYRVREKARRLVAILRTPAGETDTGRPSALSAPVLRRIALLSAAGVTQKEIGKQVGCSRWLVGHHLKPSRAMINACLEAGGSEE